MLRKMEGKDTRKRKLRRERQKETGQGCGGGVMKCNEEGSNNAK